jgi:hypothetical protein
MKPHRNLTIEHQRKRRDPLDGVRHTIDWVFKSEELFAVFESINAINGTGPIVFGTGVVVPRGATRNRCFGRGSLGDCGMRSIEKPLVAS